MAKIENRGDKAEKQVVARSNSLAERFLEDFDQCPICARDVVEPVLLPCLHSCCQRCVDRNMKENGGKVACVTCCGETRADEAAQKYDPADLTPNTLVEHIQRILAAEKSTRHRNGGNDNMEIDLTKILCGSCERGNQATRRCEDCRDFLCKTCVKVHKAVKVLKDHELIRLQEWMAAKERSDCSRQADTPGRAYCRDHADELVTQFCMSCGKLVCTDCIELSHKDPKGHVRKPNAEAATTLKTAIESNLVEAQQTAAKFTGALEILETTRRGLKEDAKRLCREVKSAIDKERETMDEREREYLDKIGDSEKRNDSEIEVFVDRAEEKLEHITNASEFADNLLDIGDDIQILNLSRTIQRRLDLLKKEQPLLPSKLDDLGVIDITQVTEQEDDVTEHTPAIDDHQEVSEGEVKSDWSLESIIGSRGSKDGQFDWCRGICSSLDGHVVVADWGNDRAQVFDNEGRFLCQLNSDKSDEGKLSMPHDVACLRDGRYVCVDKSKRVRVYDADGRFYHSFDTASGKGTNDAGVELACVTVDRRNRILVGDCKRNAITVHYADGKLLRTIPAVGPAHLATDSKDRLLVSCPQKQKIRVLSPAGKLLLHIDRFGEEGDKLKPQGLCCDDDDNIYVVHKERGGDKSVHMYDVTGEYVTCIAQGLREPYDVSLLPTGRVVVSDEDTIKVYTNVVG